MKKKFLDIWTAQKIIGAAKACGESGFSSEKSICEQTAGGELSRRELKIYTEKKLKKTVRYAAENSLFYKEKYRHIVDEAFYEKDGEAFIKGFRELPFTTAEDLRSRELDFLCVSPNEISRIVTLDTGGTTGSPKRIYFTEEDQQLTVDFFGNGMQLIVDNTDCVLILMPARIPGSIGKLLAEGLHNFGVKTVDYGFPGFSPGKVYDADCEIEKIINLIIREGVTSVVALPTHLRAIAKAAGERISLKSVLLSAEYVPDDDVKLFEDRFGCRVYEHYGMTEMGLGCAVSCGAGEGYHIREADIYIEIIDPETGAVIEDGSSGEIVFTTLTRRGMPFIRYRTGDFSSWIQEDCPCGSKLRRITKVNDRKKIKGYLR